MARKAGSKGSENTAEGGSAGAAPPKLSPMVDEMIVNAKNADRADVARRIRENAAEISERPSLVDDAIALTHALFHDTDEAVDAILDGMLGGSAAA